MNPYLIPGMLRKEQIINRVAEMYGINPESIFIKTRKQPYCEARQHVVYLLKKELKYTNSQASKEVGYQNTSTSVHASKVIMLRMSTKQLWFQLKKQKNGKKIY